MTDPLLEVSDLTIEYETHDGPLTAVSNASFTIEDGEYFGLVGESGCGKSTLAKSILGGLDPNGSIASGEIWYEGMAVHEMSESELNEEIRWTEISLIPQGSMSTLDPIERISDQAVTIARTHTSMSESEALDRLRTLFDIVGIQESRITDYPHEFSGGMQQRALIAFSLLLEPSLIISDEPTTGLDVIMQDLIFTHFDEIREELDTSMLLITHDISLVFESCDRMAVMHAGTLAERGSVYDVYEDPRHPYSILLQQAFPDIREPNRELETIDGHPPQTIGGVDECTFVDRCPWAIQECRDGPPPMESVETAGSGPDHDAACLRKHEVLEQYRSEGRPDLAEGQSDD